MAPLPTKFRAVGAAITQFIDNDECMIAAVVTPTVDLADTSRWIRMSFLRTPSRAKVWKDVWFDDRGIDSAGVPLPSVADPDDLDGVGITSIGPLNRLPRSQYFGGVYFEHSRFLAYYPKIRDPRLDPTVEEIFWKPEDWKNYELTSIAYESDPKRRYHGYEGKIVSLDAATTVADIELFRANAVVETVTLRLNSLDDCDLSIPADPEDIISGTGEAEKMLTATSAVGDKGGIYINLRVPVEIGPKLPVWLGQ